MDGHQLRLEQELNNRLKSGKLESIRPSLFEFER